MTQSGVFNNPEGQTQQFAPIFDDHQGFESTQVSNTQETNGTGKRMSIIERMRQRREGTGPSINLPPVPANTSLILNAHIMANLTDNTFSGSEFQDAQDHVDTITEIMNGYNVAGVTEDQLMLRSFPRTLTGEAKKWLKLLPPNSITTWEKLKNKFVNHFTTPAMVSKKKQKITTFEQEHGESLYHAWTRFQELLRACPQHDMDRWEILDRFYDAMSLNTRLTLDGGSPFLHLSDEDGFARLELLAKYSQDYHEKKTTKKSKKKYYGSDEEEETKEEITELKNKLEGTVRKSMI